MAVASTAIAYDLEKKDKEYIFAGAQDDVRGFVWSLPRSVIKENEKGVFIDETEEGSLVYVDNIMGVKSTIGYEFLDDKLWRVKIFSEKKYIYQQDRIDDLLLLQQKFTERFGEPTLEEFIWKKPYEKNFPEYWGWAVFRSELDIRILWQTKTGNFSIMLDSAALFEPELIMTFESLEGAQKQQQQDFLMPQIMGATPALNSSN